MSNPRPCTHRQAPMTGPQQHPGSIFTYTDGSALYAGSARRFVTYSVWEGNRVMDDAHVAALEAAIKNPQELQGPFSIVAYPDETSQTNRRIIDGQHRRAVLERYFNRNPDAPDFKVLARVYTLPSYEAILPLFQQINHAKPMVYKGSSTEQLHLIVAALRKAFVGETKGGTVVPLIRPNANRPFLNTEHLEAALKLNKIHERTDLTPTQIVAHAEAMNAFYAEDHGRIQGLPTAATVERAVLYGFYLGLDPRCSWLLPLRLT